MKIWKIDGSGHPRRGWAWIGRGRWSLLALTCLCLMVEAWTPWVGIMWRGDVAATEEMVPMLFLRGRTYEIHAVQCLEQRGACKLILWDRTANQMIERASQAKVQFHHEDDAPRTLRKYAGLPIHQVDGRTYVLTLPPHQVSGLFRHLQTEIDIDQVTLIAAEVRQ